jgi:hypothetical protein
MSSFPTVLIPLEKPICSGMITWRKKRSSLAAISAGFFSEPFHTGFPNLANVTWFLSTPWSTRPQKEPVNFG